MKTVNMHEAKTHLSRLVDEAVAGEEIIIAKNGKPFATLAAYRLRQPYKAGVWRHTNFTIPEDFDSPDEGLNKLFTDGPVFPNEK